MDSWPMIDNMTETLRFPNSVVSLFDCLFVSFLLIEELLKFYFKLLFQVLKVLD